MGVPQDRPLPAQGLSKTVANTDFMLKLEGEVICLPQCRRERMGIGKEERAAQVERMA